MKWALLEVARKCDWDNNEYTNTVWIDLPCAEEEIRSQLLSLETHDDYQDEEWEKNWDYDYVYDRYIIVDWETDEGDDIPMGIDKDCNIYSLNREIKRGNDFEEERRAGI